MRAQFEIYRDKQNKFRFRLIIDGDIRAISDEFESRTGCMNCIEAVKKQAGNAEIIDTIR